MSRKEVVWLSLVVVLFTGMVTFLVLNPGEPQQNPQDDIELIRRMAKKVECRDNLHQIGVGLSRYAEAHNGRLPPTVIRNSQGKPLFSWRVALLPYIGQGNLYRKFRRDEPWDSLHNRKVAQLIPNEYRCPSLKHESQGIPATAYLAITGPDSQFPEKGSGNQFDDTGIANLNRALIVETSHDQAVPWTAPVDITPANWLQSWKANPQGPHGDGVHFLLGTGEVHSLGEREHPRTYLP